jgi:hypothetical protein
VPLQEDGERRSQAPSRHFISLAGRGGTERQRAVTR